MSVIRCALLLLWASFAHAVECSPAYVAEAQSRCATETYPCTLITWALDGVPARCQLTNGVLSWWVGVPTTGTTIDPSSGQLIVTYVFVPIATPRQPLMLSIK